LLIRLLVGLLLIRLLLVRLLLLVGLLVLLRLHCWIRRVGLLRMPRGTSMSPIRTTSVCAGLMQRRG